MKSYVYGTVNVTIMCLKKCQKQYQICRYQMCVFFQAPNAPKPVFGGGGAYEDTTFSQTPGRLGCPLPYPAGTPWTPWVSRSQRL